MKLSDYVWKVVAEAGVKHVFMLPGGGCMHLVDSLGRNKDLTYVAHLHEQGAVAAAEAYAQYTNNLGVALVTTGPGGTNAITAVAAAWLDGTPLLVISGQVKRADIRMPERGERQLGFQELDIVSMVKPITKYAVTVRNQNDIVFILQRALLLARTGRPGPVWVDIPLDVQADDIDETTLPGYSPISQGWISPNMPEIPAIADLLQASQRPALLVGNGVRLDGREGLQALASFLDIAKVPVLTTWKAADLMPEDHPLFCGRPGSVGQRGANFAIQNADLVISVGARLDFGQIGYDRSTFARAAKKVVVDIDGAEIAKLPWVDVGIQMCACTFLDSLGMEVESLTRYEWLSQCKDWQRRYPVVLPEYRAFEDGVSNYVLLDVLSNLMTADDILVPGSSGACSETTFQAFRVKAGQRLLNSQGLGPMGFGIAAAIGACVASGGRRTVCLDGDGGFAMNIQELEVVRRLNLPIKFFVLDNGGYGSIQQTQDAYFDGRHVASDKASGLTLPDIREVSKAFGIDYCTCPDHRYIDKDVVHVLNTSGPCICVVKVSPQQRTAPRLSSGRRTDGTMFSKPLEDLWPFLDREELRRNMLIPLVEES